jgi:hypothetical protein
MYSRSGAGQSDQDEEQGKWYGQAIEPTIGIARYQER